MILETEKCKYLQILETLNNRNAKNCTQKELSKYLDISLRKMTSFLNGDTIDFWLLCRYADLLGMEIKFKIT